MSLSMKAFSGSLPENDLAFLEEYGRRHRLASRSASLRAAVRALREAEAEREYVTAFEEFEASGDAALWDGVSGDGLRA
ncbi:hypothetical protein GCM10027064_18690 [Microbacterium petrolearium]